MAIHNKTKEELINELYELQQTHNSLKASIEKDSLSHKLTQDALQASEERRKAEMALRESEYTFRKLFEDSSDAILLIDETGVFVECNQAALDLLKMTRDQFLFLSPVNVSPEYQPNGEASKESAQKMIDLAYQKELNRFDWTHINAEGGEFIVDISLMPVVLKGKTMLYTTWRNITERRKAEEALKKSEERFKAIANYAASWEAWFNNDGRLIWTNSYCEKITGYTAEEYLSADNFIKMVVSETDLLKAQKTLIDALTGTSGENLEIRCKHKRGDEVWISISWIPIYDCEGNNIGVRTSSRDITERIENDKKLKTSDRIFNHSIDMLCIAGFDGYFKVLNPSWTKSLGWATEEMLSKPWNDFVHPDDLEKTNNIKSVLVNEHEIYQFENRFLCKNGAYKWLSWNSFPYKGENIMFGVARDITDRKIAELELKKAKEKAEESDRLKSAFLANMSHEIRTPMNGILGFAELLKEPGLNGEEQQHYIRIIEKSGARMLNIINDIIDISKIEAGLMKIEMQRSNINEQIEHIYMFFKPEVEAKGMKLSFKTPLPVKEATITTDSEKVYAILTNLVKNAIKYSKTGSIEFGYNCVENQNTASLLQFYVKDTGIGIPKDRQEAIFERFIQADIADKMARQGAGLGLSISKAYVEMLKGRIWVESEEGTGSTFYFTLPYNALRVKEVANQEFATSDKTNQVGKLNFLVAEDDETSGVLISILIRKFANEIINVQNGRDAVKACHDNHDIDVILMDIQMPEMNGYEATRQIRQFNTKVVIIALTAFALTGDREKAIETGCNDYISKPVRKDELTGLIQKYFGKL